jgi:hypothetical protein
MTCRHEQHDWRFRARDDIQYGMFRTFRLFPHMNPNPNPNMHVVAAAECG